MEWAYIQSNKVKAKSEDMSQEGLLNFQSIKNTQEVHSENILEIKYLLLLAIAMLAIILIIQVRDCVKQKNKKKERKLMSTMQSMIDLSKK